MEKDFGDCQFVHHCIPSISIDSTQNNSSFVQREEGLPKNQARIRGAVWEIYHQDSEQKSEKNGDEAFLNSKGLAKASFAGELHTIAKIHCQPFKPPRPFI